MSAALIQIAIALGSVAVLLSLMAIVRRLAESGGWPAEVQRKTVHIGTGLYAMVLPFLFSQDWPIYLLIAVTLLVMVVIRLPVFAERGLGATLHSVERRSYGDFFLALAVGLVLLLSRREPLFYILPLAVLTLSDAAAALTGTAYGKRFFKTEDGQKSIEGSAVFFMITLVVSMICLLLLSDIARPNVIVMALLIAGFGTLVEADSWRGFDNLFLPVGILIFVMVHYERPPAELLAILILFSLALILFYAVAPRLGFSLQVARVYLVAAFLLISATELQNTILPFMALVLHAATRRRPEQTDPNPELDAVASIAVLSFGWLALGQAFSMNALEYFGMTFMGLCFGLSILSFFSCSRAAKLVFAGVIGAGLLWIWTVVSSMNPEFTRWTPSVVMFGAFTLLFSGAIPFLRPEAFRSNRMVKLSALAVAVPAATFVLQLTASGAGY